MTTFTVRGQPVPKARPRVTRHGVYTPKKTADWEALVGWRYKEAGGELLNGTVALAVTFYRETRVKADLDNLVKAVGDSLNGIAYGDDNQVRHLEARVLYGCDEPRAVVTVKEVTDADN